MGECANRRGGRRTERPGSFVELLHDGGGDVVEPVDPLPEYVDAFR